MHMDSDNSIMINDNSLVMVRLKSVVGKKFVLFVLE